jgi:hypothetical protein
MQVELVIRTLSASQGPPSAASSTASPAQCGKPHRAANGAQGWLAHGVQSNRTGRGVEPLCGAWDEALDRYSRAGQVKAAYGNEAILQAQAGKRWCVSPWQRSCLLVQRRFRPAGDELQLRRGIGDRPASSAPWNRWCVTAWPTIAKHTKLMVLFRHRPGTQVSLGGIGGTGDDWLGKAGASVALSI